MTSPPIPKPGNFRPAAATTKALTVTFPKPMDYAMLQRSLWVTGSAGKRVTGTVSTTAEETCWHFIPDRDWQAGAYRLVVEKTLEDLAGNSIGKPFEVDVLHPVQLKVETEKIAIPFEVMKQPSK